MVIYIFSAYLCLFLYTDFNLVRIIPKLGYYKNLDFGRGCEYHLVLFSNLEDHMETFFKVKVVGSHSQGLCSDSLVYNYGDKNL